MRREIAAILGEKVKADMAAVREGKVPMELPQFVYHFFFNRFGLPEPTDRRLDEFAAGVYAHRGVAEVRRVCRLTSG